jgi:signal transduction histidine kinase
VSLFDLGDGAWDVPELREALESLGTARRWFENVEVAHVFPSLGERIMLIGGAPLGALDMLLLTVDDVTCRRQAEAALQRSEARRREAERMETVGRLAGGVAHDFNNLLTVIIGYCGLLTDSLAHDDEATDQVQQIRVSAERAATLTDQLLAFSRRKVLQPKAFDLNPMLIEFERMIRRLLGKDIRTVVRAAPNLAWVEADPGEIGRVLMNLCLNARDAMPAGGILTLETSSTTVDEARGHHLDLPPGRYTQLSVRDTGYGMSDEMKSRIFEPFFTTKDSHKGGGLGLASVFGIVRQSGGAVSCTSQVGRGTEFIVLLPEAMVVPAASVPVPHGPVHAPEG